MILYEYIKHKKGQNMQAAYLYCMHISSFKNIIYEHRRKDNKNAMCYEVCIQKIHI